MPSTSTLPTIARLVHEFEELDEWRSAYLADPRNPLTDEALKVLSDIARLGCVIRAMAEAPHQQAPSPTIADMERLMDEEHAKTEHLRTPSAEPYLPKHNDGAALEVLLEGVTPESILGHRNCPSNMWVESADGRPGYWACAECAL